MQFRTQIPIAKSDRPIGYDSKVVSLGSCFAVNMAQKFEYFQLQNSVNPFGILFHPIAISRLIEFAVQQKHFVESDLVFQNERWHCLDAHSDKSGPDPRLVTDGLNTSISQTHAWLTNATHIIITYGTAWVYRELASRNIVANCHKLPQSQFSKQILSVEEIQMSIAHTIGMIQERNPNVQIIFTISPVRHLKDGFVENQRSKSNLLAALHQTAEQHDQTYISYFPSYEIMMDELRDYRFYADDMIHPSPIAIDYIWERFVEAHLADGAIPVLNKVDQLRKKLSHKPFNAESASHRDFKTQLDKDIESLQQDFPHMRF